MSTTRAYNMKNHPGGIGMENQSDGQSVGSLGKDLLWAGIITGLVGCKLVLSFFFPGLRTPGEMLLSGMLLLIYTIRILYIRSKLES